MTLFDLIALIILAVSALVGLVRGALREVATVVAFVGAVVIAIVALRLTAPIARAAVHPPWLAVAIALAVVFLASYIVIRVLAGGLMRGVHNIRALGAVDRAVGALFGLARGLIVLGVVYLAFNLAPPPTGTPAWIAKSRLYPVARLSADGLKALAPKGSALAGRFAPAMASAVRSAAESSDSEQSGQSGYNSAAERGIDETAGKSR